jgi:hypothetical protein
MSIEPAKDDAFDVNYDIDYYQSLRLCLYNRETKQGIYANLSKKATRHIIWLLIKGYRKAL